MRIAIVYVSEHHGNTKKLLDAIKEEVEVDLYNVKEKQKMNLAGYDMIGFASGIYYSKMHEDLIRLAEDRMPANKKVFFLYTCGVKRRNYLKAIKKAMEKKNIRFVGEYGCLGFDTYGPLSIIGGTGKGHPDAIDIREAVQFVKDLAEGKEV